MQITEFKLVRRITESAENPRCLARCEITLDDSIILDEVELIDCADGVKLMMWGIDLFPLDKLTNCLKEGLSVFVLPAFQNRLNSSCDEANPLESQVA